jgi:hypothetical protein
MTDALVEAMRAQQAASEALEEGVAEMDEMELEIAQQLGFNSVEEMEAMLDVEDEPPQSPLPPAFYDIVRPGDRRSGDPSMVLQGDGAIRTGRRAVTEALLAAAITNSLSVSASEDEPPRFRRLQRIQFIAALGDPTASSGSGAETWGLWREDPGPLGVRLSGYKSKLEATGGKAPAGWQFDPNAWWLEEHGLIMPGTEPLPLSKLYREGDRVSVAKPFARYVVTGDREVTSVLTVHDDGRWELSKGSLYDVTHLPCRSALYTPEARGTAACTPASARPDDFPVRPGAPMPPVAGCIKRDYAVLFVIGVEA